MSLEKNDKITWVDINELKPHPKNTNKHPKKQIERLAKIIKYQGFRAPIQVSNLSGYIVVGHGRLEAAKLIGLTKVPVSYQDFEDAKQELAHLNADNAIALWAEIDMKAVTESLKEINFDLDVDFLGFKNFKLETESKSGHTDEDSIPDVKDNEMGVQLGDIYILGEHRIMCGDSTDEASVAKLMNGQKADMVFTDPPYGVSYTGGLGDKGNGLESNEREMIKNDDIDLYEDACTIAAKFSNGPIFMFYSDNVPFGLYRGVEKNKGEVVALLIWKKPGGYGALGAAYKPNHEPCLLWKVKGKKLNFIGSTNENRVWEIQKEGKNKLHPTQKPVEVPERAIKNHEAKTVLDLFLGSGSTLIACEKTNRICFGMELDPHYVSVIIKRWQDFTGKQAVKL